MKVFFILGFVMIVSLTLVFAHPIPQGLQQIYGPHSTKYCSESDFGPDIYSKGNVKIDNSIEGSDICLSNNNLLEIFCGKWINPNFNEYRGDSLYAALFDCSASNNKDVTFGCVDGKCVATNLQNLAKSRFFANDAMADKILRGNATYNITNFKWVSSGVGASVRCL